MYRWFIILFCALGLAACQQPPEVPCGNQSLGGSGRDWINAVIPVPEGGYLLGGYSSSSDGLLAGNAGNWDWWLCQVDEDFHPVYSRSFGSSGRDAILDICYASNGGYFLAGYCGANDGDTPQNHGGLDIWVMKMDFAGGMEWSRQFGGSADDESFHVEPLPDGGCLLVGYAMSADGDLTQNRGDADIWVLRLSPEGNLVESKTYGGTGLEYGLGITSDRSNGWWLGGYTASNNGDFPGNQGGFDFALIHLDENLENPTSMTLGSPADEFLTCISTGNGELMLGGFYESPQNGKDLLVGRLSLEGTSLSWDTIAGEADEVPFELRHQDTGEWLLTGYTASQSGDPGQGRGGIDGLFCEWNGEGTRTKIERLGGEGDDFLLSVWRVSDGRDILAGMSESDFGGEEMLLGNENGWLLCR